MCVYFYVYVARTIYTLIYIDDQIIIAALRPNFQLLTKGCECHRSDIGGIEERRYSLIESPDAGPLLTLSKRTFRHRQHQQIFRESSGDWVRLC